MKKETTNTNSIQDSTIISTENDVKKNNDVEVKVKNHKIVKIK